MNLPVTTVPEPTRSDLEELIKKLESVDLKEAEDRVREADSQLRSLQSKRDKIKRRISVWKATIEAMKTEGVS